MTLRNLLSWLCSSYREQDTGVLSAKQNGTLQTRASLASGLPQQEHHTAAAPQLDLQAPAKRPSFNECETLCHSAIVSTQLRSTPPPPSPAPSAIPHARGDRASLPPPCNDPTSPPPQPLPPALTSRSDVWPLDTYGTERTKPYPADTVTLLSSNAVVTTIAAKDPDLPYQPPPPPSPPVSHASTRLLATSAKEGACEESQVFSPSPPGTDPGPLAADALTAESAPVVPKRAPAPAGTPAGPTRMALVPVVLPPSALDLGIPPPGPYSVQSRGSPARNPSAADVTARAVAARDSAATQSSGTGATSAHAVLPPNAPSHGGTEVRSSGEQEGAAAAAPPKPLRAATHGARQGLSPGGSGSPTGPRDLRSITDPGTHSRLLPLQPPPSLLPEQQQQQQPRQQQVRLKTQHGLTAPLPVVAGAVERPDGGAPRPAPRATWYEPEAWTRSLQHHQHQQHQQQRAPVLVHAQPKTAPLAFPEITEADAESQRAADYGPVSATRAEAAADGTAVIVTPVSTAALTKGGAVAVAVADPSAPANPWRVLQQRDPSASARGAAAADRDREEEPQPPPPPFGGGANYVDPYLAALASSRTAAWVATLRYHHSCRVLRNAAGGGGGGGGSKGSGKDSGGKGSGSVKGIFGRRRSAEFYEDKDDPFAAVLNGGMGGGTGTRWDSDGCIPDGGHHEVEVAEDAEAEAMAAAAAATAVPAQAARRRGHSSPGIVPAPAPGGSGAGASGGPSSANRFSAPQLQGKQVPPGHPPDPRQQSSQLHLQCLQQLHQQEYQQQQRQQQQQPLAPTGKERHSTVRRSVTIAQMDGRGRPPVPPGGVPRAPPARVISLGATAAQTVWGKAAAASAAATAVVGSAAPSAAATVATPGYATVVSLERIRAGYPVQVHHQGAAVALGGSGIAAGGGPLRSGGGGLGPGNRDLWSAARVSMERPAGVSAGAAGAAAAAAAEALGGDVRADRYLSQGLLLSAALRLNQQQDVRRHHHQQQQQQQGHKGVPRQVAAALGSGVAGLADGRRPPVKEFSKLSCA